MTEKNQQDKAKGAACVRHQIPSQYELVIFLVPHKKPVGSVYRADCLSSEAALLRIGGSHQMITGQVQGDIARRQLE